ncbi:MAG: LysR family transcriptional regulator, partial [Pseudomonadota bacterium]
MRAENAVKNSQNGVAVWELLRARFGVSMLPKVLSDAQKGVEKVLPDLPPPQFPIWLVTHPELRTSRLSRIVFDQLARGFKETAA